MSRRIREAQEFEKALELSRKEQDEKEQLAEAIEMSLKAKKDEEQLRREMEIVKELSIHSKEREELEAQQLQQALQQSVNTEKEGKSKLAKALELEKAIRSVLNAEQDALQQILRQGHDFISISAANNDCLYRAVATAILGESATTLEFKNKFICDFVNKYNPIIQFMFESKLSADGDSKITELYNAEDIETYVSTLREHILDGEIASDVETGLMSAYIKELSDGDNRKILFGSATHLANLGDDWDVMIVNAGLHYDVIKKQRTGGAKPQNYREIQRLAKAHGVKGLTRPAATLKRAIAYQKGRARKFGGNPQESCDREGCDCALEGCKCDLEVYRQYRLIKELEKNLNPPQESE